MVVGAPGAGRQARRPGRLHCAEHPRAARVVLRRAADRRGPGADQLPAEPGRVRVHHQPFRRDRPLRARDYLECVDGIRPQLPQVRHFVALEGQRELWLDYETLLDKASPAFERPAIEENDLLTINYTSGTTSRPKGVMITHRNAYMNVIGTLLHIPMRMADRYLWTLPMFHANGWTFAWAVTAVGAKHVCLRKVDPVRVFELIAQESVSIFCAAPTVLIGVAGAAPEVRAGAPRGIRVVTAGAPPAAAT